jgi:hypothetical protein
MYSRPPPEASASQGQQSQQDLSHAPWDAGNRTGFYAGNQQHMPAQQPPQQAPWSAAGAPSHVNRPFRAQTLPPSPEHPLIQQQRCHFCTMHYFALKPRICHEIASIPCINLCSRILNRHSSRRLSDATFAAMLATSKHMCALSFRNLYPRPHFHFLPSSVP